MLRLFVRTSIGTELLLLAPPEATFAELKGLMDPHHADVHGGEFVTAKWRLRCMLLPHDTSTFAIPMAYKVGDVARDGDFLYAEGGALGRAGLVGEGGSGRTRACGGVPAAAPDDSPSPAGSSSSEGDKNSSEVGGDEQEPGAAPVGGESSPLREHFPPNSSESSSKGGEGGTSPASSPASSSSDDDSESGGGGAAVDESALRPAGEVSAAEMLEGRAVCRLHVAGNSVGALAALAAPVLPASRGSDASGSDSESGDDDGGDGRSESVAHTHGEQGESQGDSHKNSKRPRPSGSGGGSDDDDASDRGTGSGMPSSSSDERSLGEGTSPEEVSDGGKEAAATAVREAAAAAEGGAATPARLTREMELLSQSTLGLDAIFASLRGAQATQQKPQPPPQLPARPLPPRSMVGVAAAAARGRMGAGGGRRPPAFLSVAPAAAPAPPAPSPAATVLLAKDVAHVAGPPPLLQTETSAIPTVPVRLAKAAPATKRPKTTAPTRPTPAAPAQPTPSPAPAIMPLLVSAASQVSPAAGAPKEAAVPFPTTVLSASPAVALGCTVPRLVVSKLIQRGRCEISLTVEEAADLFPGKLPSKINPVVIGINAICGDRQKVYACEIKVRENVRAGQIRKLLRFLCREYIQDVKANQAEDKIDLYVDAGRAVIGFSRGVKKAKPESRGGAAGGGKRLRTPDQVDPLNPVDGKKRHRQVQGQK